MHEFISDLPQHTLRSRNAQRLKQTCYLVTEQQGNTSQCRHTGQRHPAVDNCRQPDLAAAHHDCRLVACARRMRVSLASQYHMHTAPAASYDTRTCIFMCSGAGFRPVSCVWASTLVHYRHQVSPANGWGILFEIRPLALGCLAQWTTCAFVFLPVRTSVQLLRSFAVCCQLGASHKLHHYLCTGQGAYLHESHTCAKTRSSRRSRGLCFGWL
jgi:hypothetical protein